MDTFSYFRQVRQILHLLKDVYQFHFILVIISHPRKVNSFTRSYTLWCQEKSRKSHIGVIEEVKLCCMYEEGGLVF